MYPPLKTIHERKKKKKARGTQTNFVDHDVEQLFSGFIFLSMQGPKFLDSLTSEITHSIFRKTKT